MNISWALADTVELDPTQDVDRFKRIGPFWGSWRTWRACQTDNVICHELSKATELVKRDFQKQCNFYIPNAVYTNMERPSGVKLYAGEFVHDVIRQEEIVGLHLAATTSNIVLLLGWDLTELTATPDRLISNQMQHHRNMVRQSFITYDQIQWVIVDHPGDLDPNIANLDNVVTDNLQNVLALSGD